MDLCKKKESSGSAEDLELQYGRAWIWTAIDAPTRLLITFWVGGRNLDDARRMLKDLTARCQGKPLFVSDELPHYGTVLGELFHAIIFLRIITHTGSIVPRRFDFGLHPWLGGGQFL